MQNTLRTTLASLAVLWLAGTLSTPARAAGSDPLIEGAKLCTRHLPRYERENGIPTNLLSAIASTESGRYHPGLGLKIPWPWTINANGKSYYYKTKDEAIRAVRSMRAHGIESIDVGCMQVNLYHHPDAFASLDQAFEPETNIAYAAGFLRSLYDEEGSWRKAAADYHSRTPSLGRQYVGEVYNSWYRIIEKLRAARLQVPDGSVVAMNRLKSTAPVPHVLHMAAAEPARDSGLRAHRRRLASARIAPHMHNIEVSSIGHQKLEREDGIIVVHSQPGIPVASAAELSPSSGSPSYSAAPALHVDDNAPPAASDPDSKKTGPTFIFTD